MLPQEPPVALDSILDSTTAQRPPQNRRAPGHDVDPQFFFQRLDQFGCSPMRRAEVNGIDFRVFLFKLPRETLRHLFGNAPNIDKRVAPILRARAVNIPPFPTAAARQMIDSSRRRGVADVADYFGAESDVGLPVGGCAVGHRYSQFLG